ncbi:selenoneine biosynthesis selenosugar synthase SenB [Caenimonas aquaedulcis]|uniref:TIGR04348 family glycosyltransferase n=1 Tax=Caenimonas aquaedulcis TaxID=2793270 RepID=A0A931H6H0_9BURK|nr:selenoneine biosynthesis selenosugar synthase SenB [Caenimonas aquaedulcis]MBG9389541.1 TIGR04348 family glycosyltransferase [Caenimonas aquaedulcis]
MRAPSVVIVSPALAAANNGNWQTARRWQKMLSSTHLVRIVRQWPDAQAMADDIMLALHARRSAPSIAAWAQSRGARGLAVVLTGTDLYRDIATDPQAQQSLALAGRLVVLQSLGVDALAPPLRSKARVIYQSTTSRREVPKTSRELHAVMVGHLRDVKSPDTLFEAAHILSGRADIRITHIGEASEAPWAEKARATEAACPAYRWAGALPHAEVRRAIQQAHVLVHTSALEGGAHVIMEAACSGTPVLASRVPGNVGMLGAGYGGYFEPRDAAGLAALLDRCRAGQAPDAPAPKLLEQLRAQCASRAPLFSPQAERLALARLLQELQESP